jgi:hypothetical protein
MKHVASAVGFALALAVNGLVALIAGGTTPAAAVEACQSTFSYGSGASYQGVCISAKGNVIQFESPAASTHMAVAPAVEGYAVCSRSAATSAETKHGFDTGSIEGGFGPAVIEQPNGRNTFPLCITRVTLDGTFRLKQCFTRDTAANQVNIAMTLTNISAAKRVSVLLSRSFNGDISNGAADDRYSLTSHAVFGWQDGTTRQGLMLAALAGDQIGQTSYVETPNIWDPNAQYFATSRGCTPQIKVVTPATPGNYVGRLTFALDSLLAGQSKSITAVYRKF